MEIKTDIISKSSRTQTEALIEDLEKEVSEYKRISSLPKSAIDKLMEDESFVKAYRDWEELPTKILMIQILNL